MKIDEQNIRKILIIKFRGIGDVVLSTVILDSIRYKFPNAKVDYLTEKPSDEFLSPLDYINKIILYKKKCFVEKIKLFWKIKSNNYDMVFDFFINPFSAQLTYFSKAKYRIGLPYKGRKYAYNLLGPEERNKFHAADLHLETLKMIGIEIKNNSLHFGIPNKDIVIADKFFKYSFQNHEIVIAISPSGGWASKKCEPKIFAKIADEIVRKYKSTILILWGPTDKIEAEQIGKYMNEQFVLAPKTTITEMGAIIKNCELLITNDSGPMHISTAIGTATLSLHGPTSPHLQGPYGNKHTWIRNESLDCVECNLLECNKKHECFTELDINLVIQKVDELRDRNNLWK